MIWLGVRGTPPHPVSFYPMLTIMLSEDGTVKQMWKQVKRALVESAREVCGLVKVGLEARN